MTLAAGVKLTPNNIGGLPVLRAGDTREDYMNLMIYGYPGSGKTMLAGSADLHPEMRPVLLLDYEAGRKPITENYPDVEVIDIVSWSQMQSVYADLYNNECYGFKTIIIDTLSELQSLAMGETMAKVVNADGDRDPNVPSQREYLINLGQLSKMVRAFRNLPCNFICCIHAQDDKDQKTGKIQKKPELSGKFALRVAGFFSVVLYTYVTETEEGPQFVALSQQTNNVIAKDRSGHLPQIIGLEPNEPLNMKFIYQTYTYGA